MAEILALTASLIAVSNLGTKLTRTLYDFATTVSNAREEIDYIGGNVSDYADILELLVEQLEHDRPIHSKKAIRLAERLYDRSHRLFDRIRALIPDKQRTRDHISFLDRISWNFKKTRVHHLVGELECLKRTVQLLVQVLSTARQFQAHRLVSRDVTKVLQKLSELCRNHVGERQERQKKAETVHRHFLRAENVIIEWQRAEEKVASLREASELEDRLQIQAGSAPTDAKDSLEEKEERSLIKMPGNTLAIIEAATIGVTQSETEKRALILKNAGNWVEQLLEEWTLLGVEQRKDESSDEEGPDERGSRYDSTPKAKTRETDDTTGEPQLPPPPRISTRHSTSGKEKLPPIPSPPHVSTQHSTSGEKKLPLHTGDRSSLPKLSTKQSDRRDGGPRRSKKQTNRAATNNQHLWEQLGDANPTFQRATDVMDENFSLEPQCSAAHSSQSPSERSNGDSSLPGDRVSFSKGSTYTESNNLGLPGGPLDKGGTFCTPVYMRPLLLAPKRRRSARQEHAQIDNLRATLNSLWINLRQRPLTYVQYKEFEDQILREVILEADSLNISETDTRANRKLLINQAEFCLGN